MDAPPPVASRPPNRISDGLRQRPADGLLALIDLFRQDPRTEKLDLGVGVFRDARGATPVFAAVKAAEARLVREQATKSYLGPEGDRGFVERIGEIVFGGETPAGSFAAVQTPGGTGALRLAAGLAALGRPGRRIWLGAPTWPNHEPIFATAGLEVRAFPQFDISRQALLFDETCGVLQGAEPGDVVLLHGCCHNPTGLDPSPEQWIQIAALVESRGLLPLVDLAYQGLGDGLEEDAAPLRMILRSGADVMVAYSCDKNFGLYRERTGALFVRTAGDTEVVRSNILQLALSAWSMPPDHGAAVARIVLEDEALRSSWRGELDSMRLRLAQIRSSLAAASPKLAPLRDQRGLFASLPLAPEQVEALRRDHAIYMAPSGRINIAGLTEPTIPMFASALAEHL